MKGLRTEKILVLTGGDACGSDISRRSGANILKALKSTGYEAIELEHDESFPGFVMAHRPDLVFLALHGAPWGYGAIQGFLEFVGIPYTGSDIKVSALCQDRILTRKMLCFDEIPTPEFAIINQVNYTDRERILDDLLAYPGLPLVVKAARKGSGPGATLVKQAEELNAALDRIFNYGNQALVEKYINGMEVTVGVMGNREAYLLAALEIMPAAESSSNDLALWAGSGSRPLLLPQNSSRMPRALLRKVEALAQASYERLGCRGFARIDIVADVDEDKAYILEVNTLPGMSDGSLLVDAVRAAGMSWEEFVDRVVRLGLQPR